MSSGVFDRTLPTILFVDDDLDTLIAYECLASEEGFGVLTARDGYQALSLVEALIPDVVVLDLWLPGLDGFDVARRLRGNARTRDIPIVLLSGDDSDAAHEAAECSGCEQHLVKPIAGEELIRTVNGVVARRRRLPTNGAARTKSP